MQNANRMAQSDMSLNGMAFIAMAQNGMTLNPMAQSCVTPIAMALSAVKLNDSLTFVKILCWRSSSKRGFASI